MESLFLQITDVCQFSRLTAKPAVTKQRQLSQVNIEREYSVSKNHRCRAPTTTAHSSMQLCLPITKLELHCDELDDRRLKVVVNTMPILF